MAGGVDVIHQTVQVKLRGPVNLSLLHDDLHCVRYLTNHYNDDFCHLDRHKGVFIMQNVSKGHLYSTKTRPKHHEGAIKSTVTTGLMHSGYNSVRFINVNIKVFTPCLFLVCLD